MNNVAVCLRLVTVITTPRSTRVPAGWAEPAEAFPPASARCSSRGSLGRSLGALDDENRPRRVLRTPCETLPSRADATALRPRRAEDDQVRVLRVGQRDDRLDGLSGEPLQRVGNARRVRGVGGVLEGGLGLVDLFGG